MANSTEKLEQELQQLKSENQALQDQCDNLQMAQSTLEQIIGESNSKVLQSEMTSMELEQVFSAVTDALWVVREDGVVVRANEAMLQLLGKEMSEVVGEKCSELMDYDLCQQPDCPRKRLGNKEKQEYDIELTGGGSEDQVHYILTTAPLVTLDGTPGLVGQFKDITERKHAEEQLEAANLALERLARVDGLTQIANRRCFDETFEKEWARLARDQKPLAILLGDIDFFKKYNDHYGHQAGDDCLTQIGKAMADSIMRPADLAARYGGEEFVLLLPEVDLEGAVHVGNRVLTLISELEIPHEKSEVSAHVSMSIGAATIIPSKDSSPQELLAQADAALYQAKESGRNQVVTAAEQPDSTISPLPTPP